MHNVDIEIFCIAQTRLNYTETRRWLDRCGASSYTVPLTPNSILCGHCGGSGNDCESCVDGFVEAEVTDAGAICGLCAKRCYMSFEPGLNPNVTRVRKVWHDYLTNVLSSGHGSVIEHASWTFAIEGISRVFTGELNRHRAGVAISEGSMRYIRFDDIGFWMPKSLEAGNTSLMPTKKCKVCKGKPEQMDDGFDRTGCTACNNTGRIDTMPLDVFENKKALTREQFNAAFQNNENRYKKMCVIWDIENLKDFDIKKKLTSMFRRIVGMGVATGGTWTFNTRALRHIIALRTSPHAEEEIALVMGMIGKYMFENEPDLFGDFTLDEATGAWIPEHVKV